MKRFMIGSYNGRNAVSCLRFGLSRGSTRRRSYGVAYVHGYVLRLSGDQNMVVEGVSIQAETSRGRNLVTSEALVLAFVPRFPRRAGARAGAGAGVARAPLTAATGRLRSRRLILAYSVSRN
jgi:hypothetical protein